MPTCHRRQSSAHQLSRLLIGVPRDETGVALHQLSDFLASSSSFVSLIAPFPLLGPPWLNLSFTTCNSTIVNISTATRDPHTTAFATCTPLVHHLYTNTSVKSPSFSTQRVICLSLARHSYRYFVWPGRLETSKHAPSSFVLQVVSSSSYYLVLRPREAEKGHSLRSDTELTFVLSFFFTFSFIPFDNPYHLLRQDSSRVFTTSTSPLTASHRHLA